MITRINENRIRECLGLLETAQAIVNEAAGALCGVDGFGDEWSSLHEPYDAIKAAWHRVNARRAALANSDQQSVVSVPTPAEGRDGE